MIRIYGNTGSGSLSEVSEGLRRGCAELGLLAGFVDCRAHWREEPVPGADAPVALIAGEPNNIVTSHAQGKHAQRWFMLAPNSAGILPDLVDYLTHSPLGGGKFVDGLLAPSEWAAGVLRESLPELPVLVAPHGLRSDFRPSSEWAKRVQQSYQGGDFVVVHITSSQLQRKATWELAVAWSELCAAGWEGARLLVLCHPLAHFEHESMRRKLGLGLDQMRVAVGLQLCTADLVKLYQSCHVVCQPSRAEGFGMVPLEARGCGTPVVVTACTGHSEHVPGVPPLSHKCWESQGVVVLPHGAEAPIDDFKGAMAPQVASADIAAALRYAREHWPEVQRAALDAAPALSTRWAWPRVIAPAMTQLCLREEQLPCQ